MAEVNYTPVEVSVCKDMLKDLFSQKEAFKQFVTPNGLKETSLAGYFRPHLLSMYKWYRKKRIEAVRMGTPIDTKMPLRLEEYITKHSEDLMNEELELTLIFAQTVLQVFTHPHVIHNDANRTYRLRDPKFHHESPKIFLINLLKEYGFVPDTQISLDQFSQGEGNTKRNYISGYVDDYDFTKAYQFVFQYLHKQGLTWNFGTYIYISDHYLFPPINLSVEINPEEHEKYDPYKEVLAQIENGEINSDYDDEDDESENDHENNLPFDPYDEDADDEDHNSEIEDFAMDPEGMEYELKWKKNAISAYQNVYGEKPPGLPKWC